MTKVMPCTCVNPHQDAIHGVGRRVFNLTAKKIGEQSEFRCTSCSTTKTPSGNTEVKKKK